MSDLSFVMGIGGVVPADLIFRLQGKVSNIARLAKKHGLNAEIVIVEWNMPRDQRSVSYDVPCSDCPTRIIHVPHWIHDACRNPHGFKYFEMAPKNIGIRRANADFVLSCNPDSTYSDEMIAFLARGELKSNHFYRAHRHDTRNGEIFQVCRETGCFPVDATEQTIRESIAPRAQDWREGMLHFNASGEFMLMSKEDWFFIHGNPELEYNQTVDGQTVWLAHMKGLKQVVLPYPIYHADHERTLNVGADNKTHAEHWHDNKPHTKENGEDWGYAGTEFFETCL